MFVWEITPTASEQVFVCAAIVRGSVNSLKLKILEDQIRLHMLSSGKTRPPMNPLTI
jgi:hypothetical protein